MSWRAKLAIILPRIMDVVLRVPPLFVMDSILNQTFLVPWIRDDLTLFGPKYMFWVVVIFGCLLGSFVVFLLTTKQLIDTYCFGLSAVVLWYSYWFNNQYVLKELQDNERGHMLSENIFDIMKKNPSTLIINVCVQIVMAYLYNSFRLDIPWHRYSVYTGVLDGSFRTGTYLCLLQPVVARLISMPQSIFRRTALLSIVFLGVELQFTLLLQLKSVIQILQRAYIVTKYMIKTYGVQVFLETQWTRLHVPNVLRVFWITRFTQQLVFYIVNSLVQNFDTPEITFPYLTYIDGVNISKNLLVTGCETTVALLGMTSIVSYITHYIGVIMALFIGSDNEEDRNMGTVSAILFFILALQTGLTGLEPTKRLVRLYRNFCLLSTAILHFIHSMVNPLLMNLSASHNVSLSRHGRVLGMCAFLMLFPCWFLYYLWSHHSISTWLLAVTAFSVEVVIKVVISLLVYCLFMIDAYRDTFWEKLDDYVYYIKSTGNTIEFFFGIFLFCNGTWIMLFESGGTIRALMMCIHAYFNIWVQAKEGWKVFMKRRTAVNKINSLPLATTSQLQEHNDVCAICYQELSSARVTRCRHYFHGVCLRKWLYVQDRCPLCHELIYSPETSTNSTTAEQDEANPIAPIPVPVNNGNIFPLPDEHQHQD